MIFPVGKSKNLESFFNPLSIEDASKASSDVRLKKDEPKKQKEKIASSKTVKGVTTDIFSKSSSVKSAGYVNETDLRGSPSHIKSFGKNTIFQPDVVEKNSLQKDRFDNGEKIKSDNIKLAEKQQLERKKNFNIDMDVLKKAAENGFIKSSKEVVLAKYDVPKDRSEKISSKHVSIFDTSETSFSKIPEKTAGEKIKEDNAKNRNVKDLSWKKDKSCVSTRDKIRNLFGDNK